MKKSSSLPAFEIGEVGVDEANNCGRSAVKGSVRSMADGDGTEMANMQISAWPATAAYGP